MNIESNQVLCWYVGICAVYNIGFTQHNNNLQNKHFETIQLVNKANLYFDFNKAPEGYLFSRFLFLSLINSEMNIILAFFATQKSFFVQIFISAC